MIQNRIGFSFHTLIGVATFLFSISGVILCFTSILSGIIVVFACSFFWSSNYGVEIDTQKNLVREYSSAYGLKRGDWKPLNRLPYLTVMAARESMTIYSRSNLSTTITNEKVGVYLLTETHRTKILVHKFDEQKEAIDYARKLSKKLAKEIVLYDPIVSEKTRNRRRNS